MNAITQFIRKIGSPISSFIFALGECCRLLYLIILSTPKAMRRPQIILKEIFFTGVLSILIIAVSGWFVGMVLGLQGYNTLQRFGSVSVLGSLVAISLLRELGPVLCSILFVSRAGSSITTAIGLLKTTEQLDAMETMSIDPIQRVITPKFISGILSVPLLSAIFSTAGILGGYFVSVRVLKVDSGIFWSQMQYSVVFYNDVVNSLIKSFIFGVFVTLISVYNGLQSKPTADGVASATTSTVVQSAMTVLALDFILTSFMF